MADSAHTGLGSPGTQATGEGAWVAGWLTFQDDSDGVGPETFSSRAQGLVLGYGKSQSGGSRAEQALMKQEGRKNGGRENQQKPAETQENQPWGW